MIYDYKSEEFIQNVVLEGFDELLADIEDEYNKCHRYDSIAIYAPHDVAIPILSEVFEGMDLKIDDCSIDPDDISEDMDLLISITPDGFIDVEDARCDDGSFLSSESSIAYVYDGYTKKEVDEISKHEDSILVFGFEEDEKEDNNSISIKHISPKELSVSFEKNGNTFQLDYCSSKEQDVQDVLELIKKFIG